MCGVYYEGLLKQTLQSVGMCSVQEIRRKQLEVMLNALLRRYVEGDVEGFRVSLAPLHTGICMRVPWLMWRHLKRFLSMWTALPLYVS